MQSTHTIVLAAAAVVVVVAALLVVVVITKYHCKTPTHPQQQALNCWKGPAYSPAGPSLTKVSLHGRPHCRTTTRHSTWLHKPMPCQIPTYSTPGAMCWHPLHDMQRQGMITCTVQSCFRVPRDSGVPMDPPPCDWMVRGDDVRMESMWGGPGVGCMSRGVVWAEGC